MAVIFLLGILLLILKTKDLGAAADRDSREQVILLNQIAGCATEKADDLKELEKDGFHGDYVIVDTPPVNAVIDGVLIAKQCDGTLIPRITFSILI